MKKFLGIVGCICILLGLFSVLFFDDISVMQQKMFYTSDRGSPTYYFLGSLSDFCEESGWPFMIVGGILFIVSSIGKITSKSTEQGEKTTLLNEHEKDIKANIEHSDADELKKFKELLDNGIITPEEFDEKKKQLLKLQ